MLFLQSFALLASVVGLVNGQSIDPNSVDKSTRDQWCQAQTSSCPLLCFQVPGADGKPSANTCDSKSLAYNCVCSNGISPNASEYSQTIPYFICTEQNNQCVANCNGESSCQYNCRSDNPCGAQEPKRYNVTSTTASVPAATTSLPPFTGVADEGLAVRPLADLSQVYGLTVMVGAFLAGFRFIL